MKILTRLLLKRFSRVAGPYLRAQGLLRASGVFKNAGLVWEPGTERVVVLAPHMDDETIGCGGAIARHTRAGGQVHVVFLTDGRNGSNELHRLTGEHKRLKQIELVATRRREAQQALQVLGVQSLSFLDAEDGALSSDRDAALKLRPILEQLRPEIVYLPHFLEEHPDHRAASRVLLEAATSYQGFQCFGYEVWTPLFPNCLVAIDEVEDLKRTALSHYASQLADMDYVRTALALNTYRSAGLAQGQGRCAEAFCVQPLDAYRRTFEAYANGK